MPRISGFFGIVIEVHYRDHPPPHFHARHGDDEATVVIATGRVLAGSLPPRQLRLVRRWLGAHRAELDGNWARARTRQRPRPIEGLQ